MGQGVDLANNVGNDLDIITFSLSLLLPGESREIFREYSAATGVLDFDCTLGRSFWENRESLT